MNKTLEELANISYGKDYKANPVGDDFPIYGTGGIMGYTSMKLNSGPAILTGRKGSINNPLLVNGDFWNVDTIFCVKPKDGINLKWLFYNFRNKDLSRLNEATGVPSVSASNLYKLTFKYFKLPQQQKIAQILSTCDTVLEKTEAAIAKNKAIKQGLLYDLFTRGIDPATGKLRPSYEEAPELYKETELGFVPREWKVLDLLSVTSLITDGAHFSPTPQEQGLPIGNVKDIKNSRIDYDNCTMILPKVFELLKRQNCSPKIDDVLLSKDGTIGRVVHFTDSRQIVLLSSIAIIRPNELVFSGYLANILKSKFFDRELYKLLSGSALRRITLRDIQKIKMPYPKNIKEQIEIANRLKSIDQKIESEQRSLAKYRAVKVGLMQDLLSGVVGVEALIKNT